MHVEQYVNELMKVGELQRDISESSNDTLNQLNNMDLTISHELNCSRPSDYSEYLRAKIASQIKYKARNLSKSLKKSRVKHKHR